MAEKFLNKVYDARDAASTRKLYDDWSDSYEAEVAENGYVTPGRCAKALASTMDDKTLPVMDFGCGTGLSGLALSLEGFTTLDGLDLSKDMLAQARSKNIYRRLSQIDTDGPLPFSKGDYAAIAAIGVIGAGAAPISVLHSLMNALGTGGKLVLSFNDHALADPHNEAGLNEWLDCGAARLLFKEYGPHLTKINLKSCVYIVEKA